jgi:hypothetical protein
MRINSSRAPQTAAVTVGDLITELCGWPDHAVISFRSPATNSELCLSRIFGPSQGLVEIELQPAEERVPVVPA